MPNEIHPMQAMIDGMSAAWQRDRAATQMTLGGLIATLEALPHDTDISEIGHPHSYRGYYCDLAFEQTGGSIKASDLLALCKSIMGRVFAGYKGGDYMMGANTPIWIANYGDCGVKIMSLRADGTFETAEDA